MPSQLKPIKLWGAGGPNPPKVAIVLEELGVPYEVDPVPFTDTRRPEYLAINPNGRLPSIHDSNTSLTLWESGAILEYLVEQYDTQHNISFALGTTESYHAKQWLFFQVSGQGPYYGQAAWFKRSHPEQLPSALERYVKETNRHAGVVEGWLAKQKEKHGSGDGPWLIGDKCSFADLAFIPWHKIMIGYILSKEEFDEDNYPNMKDWIDRMCLRESVKTVRAKSQPTF